MKTISIAAPEGYHWMQYDGGPVLMIGEYQAHDGAVEAMEFEVIDEHEPERLAKESFKPPKGVQEAAQRGLELRREHDRGGTMIGVARARNLANGDGIPMETINRMVSFFARHEVDLKAPKNSDRSHPEYPGAGKIAWELWGGDAGQTWANSIADREKVDKARSIEYLEQALEMARKHLPGWAWAMIHQAARGYAGGKAPKPSKMAKCDEPLPAIEAKSLDGAKVVFVVADSNELERARGKLLVGADGVTFNEVYLKALELPRSEVAVCTLDEFSQAEITQPVVALGKLAKVALGKRAAASMPHPTAIRKLGDSGEVQRKAKGIKKTLTKAAMRCDTASKPTEINDGFTVEITKASSDELRIVYGVVLDPYAEDAHGDTIPPKEVERTAHNWMSKSRLIGLQHSGMAKAEPVESWLVPYPSDEDYQKAMRGDPHNAIRTKFGSDTVHSGTWILGTKLGQDEWQAVKSGELNAYSIGGFGKRNQVALSALPAVNFIDGDPNG
mgnify:CR=1 FL=1|tara:strand:- start:4331 stop:5833 length:1503 start_codon:yes stop_codon:yes gene_type:complete